MNDRIPLCKMLTFGLLPGCLKKLLYRLGGNHIGKHVRLAPGSVIVCREKFTIGNGSRIGCFTSVSGRHITIGHHCNIRSAVIISADTIRLGNEVTISETAIIRAGHLSEQSALIIDDLVHVFPSTILDPSRQIYLQEECAVGPGCSLFTHSSYKNVLDGFPMSYGDISIGKRVELTYNVFVGPGVTIGDDTIVGVSSYVNRDLPPNVLAAGTPATVKRNKEQFAPSLSDEEKEKKLEEILNEFDKHLTYNRIKHRSDKVVLSGNNEIIVNGTTHFNIKQHRCDPPKDDLSKALRRFLSRYGIRFKMSE